MTKTKETAAPVNVQAQDEVKSPKQAPNKPQSGTNSLTTLSEYPDEVKTISTIKILERIHKDAVSKIISEWTFQELTSLIQHTMANIGGYKSDVNGDGEFMSSDEILEQWTNFMQYYSAVYFTNENLWILKGDFECSQQPLPDE